jgi:molecular chaperone DnaJ
MADIDYYRILGIEIGATVHDIRRSYRVLAMRFHPDQNPGDPQAEERFKQITQAYKVLIDPKKRAVYDRSRGRFAPPESYRMDETRSARSAGGVKAPESADPRRKPWWEEELREEPKRPAGVEHVEHLDISFDVTLTNDEAERGGQHPLGVNVQGPCMTCNGTGGKPGTTVRRCPECDPLEPSGDCRMCGGRGHLISTPCPTCRGAGWSRETKTVTVKVPPHSREGQVIVVPGEGETGIAGQVGDLLVRLHLKAGPQLERRGNDVYSDVQITPAMAAQGGRVRINTIDATMDLLIKPGTRPGTVLRLEGIGPRIRGKERGDHYVTVRMILV